MAPLKDMGDSTNKHIFGIGATTKIPSSKSSPDGKFNAIRLYNDMNSLVVLDLLSTGMIFWILLISYIPFIPFYPLSILIPK